MRRVAESYAFVRRAGSLVPMAEFEAALTESIVYGAFDEWEPAGTAALLLERMLAAKPRI